MGRPRKTVESLSTQSNKEIAILSSLIGNVCVRRRNLNFQTFNGSNDEFQKLKRQLDNQIQTYREKIQFIRMLDNDSLTVGDLW